jgi:TctA family transporter
MALQAAAIVADPLRLLFLGAGVLMGLVLGIIPGVGGIVGLSILLPFTFELDPFTALAMLLGLSAVTVTSDTIPAVLFSVPGTVGSAATILDGFPMAKKGQAGRALGAAFTASVLGGLFGAALLGFSIPVLRPLVLLIGSPELLAICIFGLSLVAVLSGNAPMKGMAAACIGILIATSGEDSQTSTLRWTFDTAYLWDGLPLVPFALGMFALPEIADMVIKRRSISGDINAGTRGAQMQGVRDVFKHYWLVIRCASIGSLLGAIPGMGASVIDWIAYGHAARTEKGAAETFGTGDVRGVIASESSNNAKEGGALIPTIAFGVPGSASMALLLGAFLIHDIVPGPDLLTKRLDVTYSMVWSIAIANIIGAGICFGFANQLAKIALIRIGILAPIVVAVAYVGVFQASNGWGDLYAVLFFGIIGWIMKRMGWPRPPMILGFVLGGLIERYLWISVLRYDFDWLGFPIVATLLALTFFGLVRPAVRNYRQSKKQTRAPVRLDLQWRKPAGDAWFAWAALLLFVVVIAASARWEFGAKLIPQAAAWAGLMFTVIHLAGRLVRIDATARATAAAASQTSGSADSEFDDIPSATIISRAGVFFGWCIGYLAMTALIGLLPAMFLFLVGYMRFQGRESWRLSLSIVVPIWTLFYLLFHQLVHVVWPQSLLGDLFPALRAINALNII